MKRFSVIFSPAFSYSTRIKPVEIAPIIGLIICNVRAVDISMATMSRKTLTLTNFYAICCSKSCYQDLKLRCNANELKLLYIIWFWIKQKTITGIVFHNDTNWIYSRDIHYKCKTKNNECKTIAKHNLHLLIPTSVLSSTHQPNSAKSRYFEWQSSCNFKISYT